MRLRAKKLEFSNDVIRIIRELCKVVFNISSETNMENMFGLTHDELENAIQKIVNGLPARIFEPENRRKFEELKTICAREFIFFQVQEKVEDVQYKKDLDNFAKIFSKDIEKKF